MTFLFFAALLCILLLPLFGLEGRKVDVPGENTLQDKDNEDDDQNCKQIRLIVEDGNGLRSGADSAKPVELTHFER